MDALVYRLALASVAIGPALVATTLPVSWIGLPIGVAIGGAGGVYALLAALKGGKDQPRRRGPVLLRRATLRQRHADLPSDDAQKLALAETLAAAVDLRAEPEAPPSRATAVARILSRIMDSWNASDIAALPRDMTLTLTLLERLLNAEPGEAGRIAQMFRRPDVVLGLRQEIDTIAKARAAYDRAFAAFQATRLMNAADPKPRTLMQALHSLGTPDTDLWHRIVRDYDPTDPDQRNAALWCVGRPECDRATVATFLSRLPEGAQLQNAWLNGDDAFLQHVRQVIGNCNDGLYRQQEIGFDPEPLAAEALAKELDALATLNGKARWPDAQCAIVALDGRAPRPRPAWDIKAGQLAAPPARADYL
ncbi:hypothetical protein KUV73_03030 [Mameliella alba]|nr:hypothetical protein [Mameliella alba]MBY6168295.1 hypothetical protein [Mameliella alba]MBY6173316.1 hypothetical protein [Mameliella alba]